MLDLEVRPERALSGGQWELVLGMPLSQAIEVLQRESSAIKNVQIAYCDQQPVEVDLVATLTEDGVRLVFDPVYQRLKLIEIYDVRRVKLKYCNKHFCSPETVPTVEQIHHSFGPTHPGQVDVKQQVFLLLFRGILFAFPLHESALSSPSSSPRPPLGVESELPGLDLQRSLVLSRVCIFSGNDPVEARPPSFPLECFHGNCYADCVEVLRVRVGGGGGGGGDGGGGGGGGEVAGLRLHLMADDPHHSKLGDTRPRLLEREVRFGDSPEDVMRALGAPSKQYFKAEDKMRIHSPSPHKLPVGQCSDYFFNYFTFGLDVLFDCVQHRVKKLLLHTNVPGHYDFNIYYRCPFLITFPSEQPAEQQAEQEASFTSISPSTKWLEVAGQLTQLSDKPVVLNRSSSTNSVNPFGSTYCYGYQNTIFEVMRSGHIASVTIYDPGLR